LDTAESMSRLVKLWGHDVQQATAAKTGLDLARTFRPDFILLDIAMPGMDGCFVARQLHEERQLLGCCIVAVTGYGDPEHRHQCYEAGIDDFLVKPVDLARLQSLLTLQREKVHLSKNHSANRH